jgi:uncharacterized protein
MHSNGILGGLYGSSSAAGWSRGYMEQRCDYPNVFEAQVISMVANGVFDRFPELHLLLVEGGFAWAPALMWRMDQSWRALRAETPWLKSLPSDHIRRNIRWSTQPFEEPENPTHIVDLIEMMGSDRLLLFASDYPHWDFDSPLRALPNVLGADLKRKILWENASSFYGFTEPALVTN